MPKKLREAEASLRRLRAEIDKQQRCIEDFRKLQAALAPFVDSTVSTETGDPNHPSQGDSKPVRHADIAQAVLEETKGPLHISDIINAMIAKGHPLPSDPDLRQSAVYSAMLRRPAIFERVGGGRWALIPEYSKHEALQHSTAEQPGTADSALDMASLAEIAFRVIRRSATVTAVIQKLEDLGYEHKKNRRQTYISIHKALVRSSNKFGKISEDGIWELIQGDQEDRLPDYNTIKETLPHFNGW